MLKFLVIKCNENCPDHIAELFFIDDIEVPDDISNIIKAHILQTKYIKYIFFSRFIKSYIDYYINICMLQILDLQDLKQI